MEKELTTQQLIGNLVKIGHKELDLYLPDGMKVVGQNPDMFAHLVSWNHTNGEIRDSKVAFPVISMRGVSGEDKIYHENAIAHLLLLDPRNLVRAVYFSKGLSSKVGEGAGTLLKEGVTKYLGVRERNRNWWDKTALQHRVSMKTLYALFHVKPSSRVQAILFDRKYPRGSVFEALRLLKTMDQTEAAGTILKHKIPFMIAIGALGGVKKNSDVVLSLVEGMSGAELITNSKMLVKMGVMENPVLKASYENGIQKAQKDKKVSSLKMSRAASVVQDTKVKAKLEKAQETKIDSLKGLEGDWLILGDMSGSMNQAVEKAKEVAAVLARSVKGKVSLVFFNTRPVHYDVSGKTLEDIKRLTSGVRAGGGTSIGCGLQLVMEKKLVVNGIVVVSDGGENIPPILADVYRKYESLNMISPNVYLLHLPGERDSLSNSMKNLPYEKVDVQDIDYYAMPNLLKILRSSRYTLVDEIMSAPLLTIDGVLNNGRGEE